MANDSNSTEWTQDDGWNNRVTTSRINGFSSDFLEILKTNVSEFHGNQK